MAIASRRSTDMPGIHTPMSSRARTHMSSGYFGQVPRYSATSETSGRQVTELDTHETRKRSHSRYVEHSRNDSQNLKSQAWANSPPVLSPYAKSPPPLAHDRYELAGGGTNQSLHGGRHSGDCDDYFQLEKQRGMWSIPPTPQGGAVQNMTLDNVQATPNGTKSWTFMGIVGGVAGKLIQFCTVPFRGFQAGSGQKFNVDSNDEIAAKLGLNGDACDPSAAGSVQLLTSGAFYNDHGTHSDNSPENERPRMTKRLRTADNWIVVDNNGDTESRPGTPRLSERRVPGTPSSIPRPLSRAGTSTPAFKRPSLIPVSRQSSADRRTYHGSAKAVASSHNRQRSHGRQNFGSPVVFNSKPNRASNPSSPLPKESQRLINKVRREEIEEDARVSRMSSQMSAMLKEAREALGSKFEVEDFDDDEMHEGRPTHSACSFS